MIVTPVFPDPTLTDAFCERLYALPDGERIRTCLQCGSCSGVCPYGYVMEYPPGRMIAALRADVFHRVMQSESVWMCISCYACADVCPSKIPLTLGLMTRAKEELLLAGKVPAYPGRPAPEIPGTPEQDQDQGRGDRSDDPYGRKIKNQQLHRTGRVYPGNGGGHHVPAQGEEKHNGGPCRRDGTGPEARGALREPEGLPGARNDVDLGEDRHEENEDTAGGRKDFQVNRSERHSGIEFHHRAR